MSYCNFANALPEGSGDPNQHYHDCEYGFPIHSDKELFRRLVLEINQAGLNWTLILNKRAAFDAAYCGFNIAAVEQAADAPPFDQLKDQIAALLKQRKTQEKIAALLKEHGIEM